MANNPLLTAIQKQLSTKLEPRAQKRAIQDLVEALLQSKLNVDNVISVLKKDDVSVPEIGSIIVDTLWFWFIRKSELNESGDAKKILGQLIARLQEANIVTKKMLVERLPRELVTADGSKVVPLTEEEFYKKTIVINTNIFMRQQKFNLLREESEGYSKLITELNTNLAEDTADRVLRNVQSLIGYFDLDPNRAFDLILESFEHNLQEKAFFKLIDPFPRTYLPHILGFKFQTHYAQGEGTPKSLFDLTALLIQYNYLSVHDIYPHLKPTNEEMQATFANELKEADAAIHTTNLKSTKGNETKKDKREKLKAKRIAELKVLQQNQKFGLVEALIDRKDWNNVDSILNTYEWPMCPGVYPPIASSLCKRLHALIEPLYTPISPFNNSSSSSTQQQSSSDNSPLFNKNTSENSVTSFPQLISVVFPIVCHVGPYLHRDVVLFCKLCRLLTEFLKNHNPDSQQRQDIATFIGNIMLPTLSLVPANPALGIELWDVLKYFHYQERFRMYGLWHSTNKYPLYIMTRAIANVDTKKILSRIVVGNVKTLGREIAKITHSHPDVVFYRMLKQMQSYSNLIQPMVDTLKYLTNLSFDVLNYCLICHLANQGDFSRGVKQDGFTAASWLINLAQFSGYLYKKHAHKIELAPMVQYISNQLLRENANQLVVLKEIIEKISGIFCPEVLNDDQLLMLCSGGSILRDALLDQHTLDENKQVRTSVRAVDSLAKALTSTRLVLLLYILIAQRRANILFDPEESHVKVIGENFDKVHETLLLYMDFINYFVLNDKHSAAPKQKLYYFVDLIERYHIESESVFHLLRQSLHLLYSDIKREGESSSTSKRKLVDDLLKCIPKSVQFGVEFYCLFWSLRLSDINVPTQEYDKLLKINASDENKCKLIHNEMKEQERKFLDLYKRLEAEKNTWFTSLPNTVDRRCRGSELILEHCILPRCLYSSVDAIFCAKFVKLLHQLDIDAFSIIIYMQKIFDCLSGIMFCCSEAEASRLGRFLSCTLSELKRWKTSQKTFEKECGNLVSFADFRRVTAAWEINMQQTIVHFLVSSEYVKMRNAVLVLNKLVGVFPSYARVGQVIEEKIADVANVDKQFSDIKTKAESYRGKLEKMKSSLLPDEALEVDLRNTTQSSSSSKNTYMGISTLLPGPSISSSQSKIQKNPSATPPSAATLSRRSPSPPPSKSTKIKSTNSSSPTGSSSVLPSVSSPSPTKSPSSGASIKISTPPTQHRERGERDRDRTIERDSRDRTEKERDSKGSITTKQAGPIRTVVLSNQSQNLELKRHATVDTASGAKRKRERKSSHDSNPTKIARTRSSNSPSSKTNDKESESSTITVTTPSGSAPTISNSPGPMSIVSSVSSNGGTKQSPREREKRDREPLKDDREAAKKRRRERTVESTSSTTTITISNIRNSSPQRTDIPDEKTQTERLKEKERELREKIEKTIEKEKIEKLEKSEKEKSEKIDKDFQKEKFDRSERIEKQEKPDISSKDFKDKKLRDERRRASDTLEKRIDTTEDKSRETDDSAKTRRLKRFPKEPIQPSSKSRRDISENDRRRESGRDTRPPDEYKSTMDDKDFKRNSRKSTSDVKKKEL